MSYEEDLEQSGIRKETFYPFPGNPLHRSVYYYSYVRPSDRLSITGAEYSDHINTEETPNYYILNALGPVNCVPFEYKTQIDINETKTNDVRSFGEFIDTMFNSPVFYNGDVSSSLLFINSASISIEERERRRYTVVSECYGSNKAIKNLSDIHVNGKKTKGFSIYSNGTPYEYHSSHFPLDPIKFLLSTHPRLQADKIRCDSISQDQPLRPEHVFAMFYGSKQNKMQLISHKTDTKLVTLDHSSLTVALNDFRSNPLNGDFVPVDHRRDDTLFKLTISNDALPKGYEKPIADIVYRGFVFYRLKTDD